MVNPVKTLDLPQPTLLRAPPTQTHPHPSSPSARTPTPSLTPGEAGPHLGAAQGARRRAGIVAVTVVVLVVVLARAVVATTVKAIMATAAVPFLPPPAVSARSAPHPSRTNWPLAYTSGHINRPIATTTTPQPSRQPPHRRTGLYPRLSSLLHPLTGRHAHSRLFCPAISLTSLTRNSRDGSSTSMAMPAHRAWVTTSGSTLCTRRLRGDSC